MREVPALARGLRILELLADAKQPLRVADIAARLDIPRSATYELISTLRLRRFIEQDSDGRMSLGAKLAMLGASFESGIDLPRLAADAARGLRDRSDETVQVAVLDDRHVLYIAKADSSRQLRLVSSLGRRLPAHVTGLGKVLLAALPADEFDRRMAGVQLESFTSTSIADPGHPSGRAGRCPPSRFRRRQRGVHSGGPVRCRAHPRHLGRDHGSHQHQCSVHSDDRRPADRVHDPGPGCRGVPLPPAGVWAARFGGPHGDHRLSTGRHHFAALLLLRTLLGGAAKQ